MTSQRLKAASITQVASLERNMSRWMNGSYMYKLVRASDVNLLAIAEEPVDLVVMEDSFADEELLGALGTPVREHPG